MREPLSDMKVYHSKQISDILPRIDAKLAYPYTEQMLLLCKKQNPFPQEYYYITKGESFAFFVIYISRMNIFTLGKKELFMQVKTIGYPCSISDSGYVTNDLEFLLSFLKTLKGGKLVLNVSNPIPMKHMVLGETLPTCMLNLSCTAIEEYMGNLRSPYRRRIKKAIQQCNDICVKEVDCFDEKVYRLYLNTYEKSAYKLERLNKGFFDGIDGVKLVFMRQDKPVGFVLLKPRESQLDFLFCGMNYETPTADLYFYMLYQIVCYALSHGYARIDLGQTSEQTKMKFGALLEKRYFYAHHSNPFWNLFAKLAKPLLEYRYSFPEYRVFKYEHFEQI